MNPNITSTIEKMIKQNDELIEATNNDTVKDALINVSAFLHAALSEQTGRNIPRCSIS